MREYEIDNQGIFLTRDSQGKATVMGTATEGNAAGILLLGHFYWDTVITTATMLWVRFYYTTDAGKCSPNHPLF